MKELSLVLANDFCSISKEVWTHGMGPNSGPILVLCRFMGREITRANLINYQMSDKQLNIGKSLLKLMEKIFRSYYQLQSGWENRRSNMQLYQKCYFTFPFLHFTFICIRIGGWMTVYTGLKSNKLSTNHRAVDDSRFAPSTIISLY